MAFPLVPVLLGAGVLGVLALSKNASVITKLPAGAPPPPPPPTSPPPPAAPGQLPPLPPGFGQQASGAVVPIITAANGAQFLASSSPESIGPPPAIFLDDKGQPVDLIGMCLTLDIGAARLNVQGITSGNMFMKAVSNFDPKTNTLRATPIDPRLPTGLPSMSIPIAAVSGFGDCP